MSQTQSAVPPTPDDLLRLTEHLNYVVQMTVVVADALIETAAAPASSCWSRSRFMFGNLWTS